MEKTKQLDKASVHSGRANSKGVAYNANHNTMDDARSKQPHIDHERTRLNKYMQYMDGGQVNFFQGGNGGFNAKKHERERYEELYKKGLDARNSRYTNSGHKERCKTMAQFYKDPKTAPIETIFQVGKQGSEIAEKKRTQVLVAAWQEVFCHLSQKYSNNLIPLDFALHRDETNDHIHFRFTLAARDKFGHLMPNQNAALEEMGFKPEPGKLRGRYNNPLVTFTDELRETFYRACERNGIQIDREVTSGSRRQLELLTQKCLGLQKEIEQHESEIQKSRLELEQNRGKLSNITSDIQQAKGAKELIDQAAQDAQKAMEIAQSETMTLHQKLAALKETQSALEEKNNSLNQTKTSLSQKLEEIKAQSQTLQSKNRELQENNSTLEKRNDELQTVLEEARSQGRATVAANKQLRNQTEQLKSEKQQLQADIDGMAMQNEQLRQARINAERETAEAKAEKEAAVKATSEMQKHQREIYLMYSKGPGAKVYEEIEARPEKKNLRGQVVQAARPACVIVDKAGFEKMEEAARYHCAVDYTSHQIDQLAKNLSSNDEITALRAKVSSQEREITALTAENRQLSQKQQIANATIERQQEVLRRHGLENQVRTQEHDIHRYR